METEERKPTSEHFALEYLKHEQEKSKAEIRGKNAGILALTVAVIVIAVGMAIINYKNDRDWRDLFSSYDFITQDGEGINNVNSGEQGDLNNGATSFKKEEQENRQGSSCPSIGE